MAFQPISISASKLARLSDRQRTALDRQAMGLPAIERQAVIIPVDSLPATTQFALVALHYTDNVCRAVTNRLRHSTMRYNQIDLQRLRKTGLATYGDKGKHILTEEGFAYARAAAARIAKEMGLHVTWIVEHGTRNHQTANCTCGWSQTLQSHHLHDFTRWNSAIQQHLQDMAQGRHGGGGT